jgi:hypothetical protein
MSDKRMNKDEPGDPRVSAAYREMADERSPDHLDHIILNAARGAARPRWKDAVAWLRPAAWVATIGVCLAIVIEISLLPDPGPAEFDSVPPATAPPAVTSPAAAKRLEKAAPQAAEPAAAHALRKPARGPSADPEVRSDEAEALNRVRELHRQEAFQEDTAPAAMLQSAPATTSIQETLTERYCDETATADPNSWLECILELERQGLLEAARLERERLALAFPPPELP